MWGTQNPNLDPETILNYETGISKTFFKNLLKTEITIFSVSGDNLISMIPVNGILKFMNSGEISNQGIEVAIDAAPGEKFSVNATYSYIHMKNPVYATPEHHVYLSASYRLKKLQLNGNIQQIVNLDNDATPTFNPVDYITVQAKAAYHFTNYLHLFVSADNLFNQKYEVNRFYTMPGATLFTGINFRF
jgi:iron complex outermembrane receptor protein